MTRDTSIFFYLPRELRDDIYTHYLKDDRGYVHNSDTGKVRRLDGSIINHALMYTCKTIAHEMSGHALRVNAIRFRTQVSVPEAVDLPSKAGYLEDLIYERRNCLQHMIDFAYKLVTPELLDTFSERWPGIKAVKCWKKELQDCGVEKLRARDFTMWRYDSLIDVAKNTRMMDDFVGLLATDPEFNALTSMVYAETHWERMKFESNWSEEQMQQRWEGVNFDTIADSCHEPETGRLIYTKDTQHKIIEWRPDFWWIPEKADLAQVEQFIVTSPAASEFVMNSREYIRKRSFSAAATAIRFLERMPLHQRLHMRKLIVEEDHPSVLHPYTHGRGFVRLCQENAHLKVERILNIWPAVFVPCGTDMPDYTWYFLSDMCDWIREVKELRGVGMPDGAFNMIIRGPSSEFSQHLCDIVTKAVTLQKVSETLYPEEGSGFPPKNCVCEDFVELIDDILHGRIQVQFEGELGRVRWDKAAILDEHQGTWPRTFEDVFGEHALREPDGGWEAASNEYIVEIDPVDRLEWWNTLVDAI